MHTIRIRLQNSLSIRRLCCHAIAIVFLGFSANVADGDQISKTFYGTAGTSEFNAPVVTGAFSGDTGANSTLDKEEVESLTINIYLPESQVTYTFSYGSEDGDSSLPAFRYEPDAENTFELTLFKLDGSGSIDLDLASRHLWLFGLGGAVVYMGETQSDNFTFGDIGAGVNYGGLEADILLGLHSGLIDNSGMANSLLTMLEAAGSADGNDNPQAAAKILEAFIHRVEAQSGKGIDPWMADLLIEDALMVIESLL